MREIDTQVTTYDPDLAWTGLSVRDDPIACMFPVEDGTGDWVALAEHEAVVSALQQRIVYLKALAEGTNEESNLENVCYEQTRMLTGD